MRRMLLALGGVLALGASVLLLRVVLHGYTDHHHLDVLHLVVGLGMALAGVVLARRALPRPGT